MKYLQQAVEQYQSKMSGLEYPPCFGKHTQWAEWLSLEQEAKTEPRGFACRDCTRQFQVSCIKTKSCLIPNISVEYVARDRG